MSNAAPKRTARDSAEVLKKGINDRTFFQNRGEAGGISGESLGRYLAIETIRWTKIKSITNVKPV